MADTIPGNPPCNESQSVLREETLDAAPAEGDSKSSSEILGSCREDDSSNSESTEVVGVAKDGGNTSDKDTAVTSNSIKDDHEEDKVECSENEDHNYNERVNIAQDKVESNGSAKANERDELDEAENLDKQKESVEDTALRDTERTRETENICLGENVSSNNLGNASELSMASEEKHVQEMVGDINNIHKNSHIDESLDKSAAETSCPPTAPLLNSKDEQFVNRHRKDLSPEIFTEGISSDGGSIEMAEEAAEETFTLSVASANNSDLDIDSSRTQASNMGDSINECSTVPQQHSRDVQSQDSLVKCSIETDVHSGDLEHENLVCRNPHQTHIKGGHSGNVLIKEGVSGSPSAVGQSGDITKAAEDGDDALLSELAAELDESAPGDGSTIKLPNGKVNNQLHIDGDEVDEKVKLTRMVDEWKKKYCHAEAELQSMKATVQAKSSQCQDLEQERTKTVSDAMEAKAVNKVHLVRIKELEKELEQRKKEIAAGKERQMSHDMAAKKAISQLQQEMVLRVDQVKHMYEDTVKEKENMVIRYAKSEKENLDLKKMKDELEKRLRDAGQGVEVMGSHNKQLKVDRAKLMTEIETKDGEIASLKKEIEEMKDDVSSAGIKVKWAQNKLKNELESHKESKVKLAKTEQRLVEAKEETEQIRKNCQEMIRTYQESEEIRSNSLDIKLKEKEEELKQHFQEKEDQMEVHQTRLKELEALKKSHHDTLSELESLKVKSKCLEDERLHTEGLLTQFKGLLNSQKEENRKLSKQMEELKSMRKQLEESRHNVEVLNQSIRTQKQDEKDLESELGLSRQKETELLQFTEKLTTTNAELHSQNSSLSSKVDSLTDECRNLKAELEEAKTNTAQLTADLTQEKQYREREAALLSARLSEKTKAMEQLMVQLDDAKDETKTLKRKHTANTKDLTRQLHQAHKKLEALENDGNHTGNNKDNLSTGSRTSSTGSLDTLGNSALNGSGNANISSGSSVTSGSVGRHDDSPQAMQDHTVAIASGGNDFPGIDKAMLVDRIVRLQKQHQRKNDKIEFMQEHINQLVEEVQKKSKIIQQYIMREEAGALAPASSDANKAQMSKQGGIMASLYRSHSADPGMTLDLSLQINQKLQAVLEDTLLKNITLKENIDTLGREIARLSEEMHSSSGLRSKSGRK